MRKCYFVDISLYDIRVAPSLGGDVLWKAVDDADAVVEAPPHLPLVKIWHYELAKQLEERLAWLRASLAWDSNEVWFTGVGLDTHPAIVPFIEKLGLPLFRVIPASLATANGLGRLISDGPGSFYKLAMAGSDMADFNKLPKERTAIADFHYPVLLVDMRTNTSFSLLRPSPSGSLEVEKILHESSMGEILALASLHMLREEVGLKQCPKSSIGKVLEEGNTLKVDLTVGDIYGSQCSFLPLDLIASSLGKANGQSSAIDFLRSIIFTLLSNIPNIAGKLVG